jgi:phosphoribosyl 1,2-cyclic phosphate phosphodiesterase
VLGCGTSTGVPRVGSGWGACDPQEPRNRRLRSSILIESAGERLLVDCGPDLREQMLAAEVESIDGVLVTHDHADHCHGIDDLRPFAQQRGRPLPIHARADVLASLTSRFGYIFEEAELYPAVAEAVELGREMTVGEARLRFVDQPHGGTSSLGMRIDRGGRSTVYAIDFNDMTDAMRELYQDADVWICDCLSRRPHPSHAHLDAVLGWARELRAGQLYLSHLSNSMDYASLVAELPDWAAPAHDGLEIAL